MKSRSCFSLLVQHYHTRSDTKKVGKETKLNNTGPRGRFDGEDRQETENKKKSRDEERTIRPSVLLPLNVTAEKTQQGLHPIAPRPPKNNNSPLHTPCRRKQQGAERFKSNLVRAKGHRVCSASAPMRVDLPAVPGRGGDRCRRGRGAREDEALAVPSHGLLQKPGLVLLELGPLPLQFLRRHEHRMKFASKNVGRRRKCSRWSTAAVFAAAACTRR